MRYEGKKYEKFLKLIKKIPSNYDFIKKNQNLSPAEIYKAVPLVYKSQIMNNYESYISKDFFDDYEGNINISSFLQEVKELSSNHDRIYYGRSGKKWILETTTGSTGKPFTVVKDGMEKLLESKYLFDQRKKFYKDVTPENGFLLLQPVDDYIKSVNYRGNSSENMPLIVNYMIKTCPKWLLTTTLLLRKMVSTIKEMEIEDNIRSLHLKFIETTSQALQEEEKAEIKRMFGCPVVNQFGCREVWNIAYECPCGKMHVNDKYLMVDIVNQDGDIIENNNESGDVIITSFLHTNFSFIKYYLGDHACFSGEECKCGNKAPVIVFSGGRKKDKLLGSDAYGTEIFRKVMRFIYFKHPELEVKDISILQKDEKHLEVSVFLKRGQEERFKMYFKDTFDFLIMDNDYVFEYIFLDKLINDVNDTKPEIFKNYYA